MEQAFAHAHQRVFGAVGALREEVEVDMVVDDVDGLVERVIVLAHGCHAIADAEDGQDTQEVKDLGHGRVLEDIASRNEHLPDVIGRKQHQGIHQRIAVVDAEDDGTVFRKMLFAMHFKASVGTARIPIHIGE